MSTESKSFDPRQVVDELINFVRERASDARNRGFAAKPTEQQIEVAILSAISTDSKNVTDIIKAISVASGGTWQPTAGQIQSSLAKLIEAESASSKNKGDRKVYSVTKTGLEALAAAANQTDDPKADQTSTKNSSSLSWMTCDPKFLKSASKLGPALLDIAQTGTREQQTRAAEVLEKARHELHIILAEK